MYSVFFVGHVLQGQGEVPGGGAVADQRVQSGEGGQAVFFVFVVVVALADVRQARFGKPGAQGVDNNPARGLQDARFRRLSQ